MTQSLAAPPPSCMQSLQRSITQNKVTSSHSASTHTTLQFGTFIHCPPALFTASAIRNRASRAPSMQHSLP